MVGPGTPSWQRGCPPFADKTGYADVLAVDHRYPHPVWTIEAATASASIHIMAVVLLRNATEVGVVGPAGSVIL